MTFKQSIVALKGYLLLAPNSNKDKIRTVIKLYEDKKIVNFKTALNTITWLASQNKNVIKSGKADRAYDKVVGKYRDAPSMVGRLKGVDAYEQKHFKITVIFYASASDNDQTGKEQERRLARRKNTKYFKTLRQCFFGEYYLKLKFPLSQGAGELFNQYFQRLLTIDKKALETNRARIGRRD